MMQDPRKINKPETVNEVLQNRIIRHSVYIIRLAGAEVKWLADQIPELRKEVMDAIAPVLVEIESSEGLISQRNAALIEKAGAEAAAVTLLFFSRVVKKFRSRLSKIAIAESEFERRLFQKTIPIKINFKTPSDELIQSLMDHEPLYGKPLDEWFNRLSASTQASINKEIRSGIIEGEGVDSIVRRIRGTRAAGYRDGVLNITTNKAKAIVTTAVQTISDRARTAFHEENEDLIRGYNVSIALDSKTCLQCVSMEDGNTYPVSERPHKPFHWRCRCEVVPVTKSYRKLGIDLDEPEPGTRASMDGEVPDNWTYSDWFKRQPADVQEDILGPSRYRAYKNGADVTAFTDNGRILTLDELRASEPDLF